MVFLEFLDVCISLCCLLLEKDRYSCWKFSVGSGGIFCWRRRRMSQRWPKHFSFGQANIVQVLNAFMRRLQSSWLSLQNAEMLIVCCMQSPPKDNFHKFNCVYSQMSITAHKLYHHDFHTCTKSNSSWPTTCGISYKYIYEHFYILSITSIYYFELDVSAWSLTFWAWRFGILHIIFRSLP